MLFTITKDSGQSVAFIKDAPVEISVEEDEPVSITVTHDGSVIYAEDSFTWTPVQEEEIVEALKEIEVQVEDYRIDAGTTFVAGGCSLLANALVARIPGSHVVAVFDALDEDGDELDQPHMIHAGVALPDGQVLDINGTTQSEQWFEQWSELGLECHLHEWAEGVAPFEHAGATMNAETFAFALSVACARSCGLVRQPELESAVAP